MKKILFLLVSVYKMYMEEKKRLTATKTVIQNCFHYAITGQTAPEIIFTRADHTKDHMGLQIIK